MTPFFRERSGHPRRRHRPSFRGRVRGFRQGAPGIRGTVPQAGPHGPTPLSPNVPGIPGVPEDGVSRPQACPAPFTYGYISQPAPARRAPKGCAAAGHAFVMRRRRRRPSRLPKRAFCTSGRRLTITASNLCKRELRLPRTRPTEFLLFCMRMAGSSIDTPRRLEHHTKSHGCLFPRGSGHPGRGHRPIVPSPSSRTEQNALCVRGTSSSRFPMGLRRCRLTFRASPACRRAAIADRRHARRLSRTVTSPNLRRQGVPRRGAPRRGMPLLCAD